MNTRAEVIPRQTSLEAILRLRDSRVLGHMQMKAWEALELSGPLTAAELVRATSTIGIHKRLSELKRMGLVSEQPPRICKVTGRRAIAWSALPYDPAMSYERDKPRVFWVAFQGDDTIFGCTRREGVTQGIGPIFKVREVK